MVPPALRQLLFPVAAISEWLVASSARWSPCPWAGCSVPARVVHAEGDRGWRRRQRSRQGPRPGPRPRPPRRLRHPRRRRRALGEAGGPVLPRLWRGRAARDRPWHDPRPAGASAAAPARRRPRRADQRVRLRPHSRAIAQRIRPARRRARRTRQIRLLHAAAAAGAGPPARTGRIRLRRRPDPRPRLPAPSRDRGRSLGASAPVAAARGVAERLAIAGRLPAGPDRGASPRVRARTSVGLAHERADQRRPLDKGPGVGCRRAAEPASRPPNSRRPPGTTPPA
jgi:hypothetical protein